MERDKVILSLEKYESLKEYQNKYKKLIDVLFKDTQLKHYDNEDAVFFFVTSHRIRAYMEEFEKTRYDQRLEELQQDEEKE